MAWQHPLIYFSEALFYFFLETGTGRRHRIMPDDYDEPRHSRQCDDSSVMEEKSGTDSNGRIDGKRKQNEPIARIGFIIV
jgi:hypothetical protein